MKYPKYLIIWALLSITSFNYGMVSGRQKGLIKQVSGKDERTYL